MVWKIRTVDKTREKELTRQYSERRQSDSSKQPFERKIRRWSSGRAGTRPAQEKGQGVGARSQGPGARRSSGRGGQEGSRAADQRDQGPSRTGRENGFRVDVGNHRCQQTEANSRRSAGQNNSTEGGARSQDRGSQAQVRGT